MIIPTRIDEKEDLALFFRLSRNPDFAQYRDWLTRNLEFFTSESMDRMDHAEDCIAKGAAIDGTVGTDFDVVFDDHIANMRQSRMLPVFC